MGEGAWEARGANHRDLGAQTLHASTPPLRCVLRLLCYSQTLRRLHRRSLLELQLQLQSVSVPTMELDAALLVAPSLLVLVALQLALQSPSVL
jgi:hypothetical protein